MSEKSEVGSLGYWQERADIAEGRVIQLRDDVERLTRELDVARAAWLSESERADESERLHGLCGERKAAAEAARDEARAAVQKTLDQYRDALARREHGGVATADLVHSIRQLAASWSSPANPHIGSSFDEFYDAEIASNTTSRTET